MAFHLLERDREGGKKLAGSLVSAMERIGHCADCRTFSENARCSICMNERRDAEVLCVLESPMDLSAIEQGTDYRGKYFVLMGRLSPLDGIGPEDVGLDRLAERLDGGTIRELIVATSATVEGEATAHYLAEMARNRKIRVTRLAQGVPIGGELEFVDGGTLSHALSGRREL